MALTTQVKLLQALSELFLGNGDFVFPQNGQPKPTLPMNTDTGLPLPRSTPEREGLQSAHLESFYRTIAGTPGVNAHALLVLRHGKVVAEGYFSPYRKKIWHVAHSLCKTFTGTAVGMAMQEGLFSLDDTVATYFADKTSLRTSKKLRSITVRHLLTMTSGITFNEASEAVESDWLKGIFSSSVAFTPGSQFSYNSMNSFLLSALVHKTSGQSLIDYLTPRLFDPLGFYPLAWEQSPDGYEKGGWGMYLFLEDIAKIGQFYLQEGTWQVDGKPTRLLNADYIRQATKASAFGKEGEAYGYHLWVDPDSGSYAMNGMFGQYATVAPHSGIVIAMTAGSPYFFADSPAYEAMRSSFFSLKDLPASLPADPLSLASLQRTLSSLRFRRPADQGPRLPKRTPTYTRRERWNLARSIAGQKDPALLQSFCGITWAFPANRGSLLPIIIQTMDNNFSSGVKALRLETQADGNLSFFWEEGKSTYSIPIGLSTPMESAITAGDETFLIASSAAIRPNEDGDIVLLVEICFLEHSSLRLLKLTLQGKNLLLRMDEQPQFSVGVQSLLSQEAATSGKQNHGTRTSLSDILLGSDYVHYRVAQLCTPEIHGQPDHSPHP